MATAVSAPCPFGVFNELSAHREEEGLRDWGEGESEADDDLIGPWGYTSWQLENDEEDECNSTTSNHFIRSILFTKPCLHQPSLSSTDSASSTCSSANSSGSWATSLSGPTGDSRPRRKSVGFHGTDRVVLIPARVDYDEETRSEIWWSLSDYEGFKEATKTHFQQRGSSFHLSAGVSEKLELSL